MALEFDSRNIGTAFFKKISSLHKTCYDNYLLGIFIITYQPEWAYFCIRGWMKNMKE